MIEVTGKHNKAKVFTDNVDSETYKQVLDICNIEAYKNNQISIMSDCHAGAGCVIGTTMRIESKAISPNLVGVDIGCGLETVLLKISKEEMTNLLPDVDDFINNNIPSGRDVHEKALHNFDLNRLLCVDKLKNKDRILQAISSLGGGNHFCECGVNSYGEVFFTIHSGSRNLGKQVAEYYQDIAYKQINNHNDFIQEMKEQGREKEIETVLKKSKFHKIPKSMSYLKDDLFVSYIHDMKIVQEYAMLNRRSMIKSITDKFKLKVEHTISTVHNYIDTVSMILRKGAVSAQKGEFLVIPINMKDGFLICKGKGNSEWNFSAPHGAGRVYSRSACKAKLSLEEYQEQMEGIYTSCVGVNTLDEAPNAYKPMSEIIGNILPTVDILDIVKPIYNFKAH